MEDLVEKLREIGFNSYEAKVYIALLKKFPATGYEVSKLANIPQARAYDTLKALENDNIVIATPTKPVTYTPIKPQELTKRFRQKFTSTLDFLNKKLPVVKDDYTEPVISVNGENAMRNKICEAVRNAQKEIFVAAWSKDFRAIEPELLSAYHRGLEVKIVGFDGFICNFGTVSWHVTGKDSIPTIASRMIFVAVDNKEGIFGITENINKNIDPYVLWTKNEEIVFLIKSFIVHDMYLTDIAEQFPEQLKYFYGAGLKKLHDKILMGTEFPKK